MLIMLMSYGVRFVRTTGNLRPQSVAEGPDATTDGCTPAAVQSAINAAATGDLILMTDVDGTSPCTVNWSSGFVSTSKGLTLDLNTSTITRTGGTTPLFSITASSTMFRLANGHFVQTSGTGGGADDICNVITIDGAPANAKFRLDHLTMTSNSVPTVFATIAAWGLIDHSTFAAPDNSEMLHFRPASGAAYTDAITPGSQDAIYVEDSTFTNNGTGNGSSAVQTYDFGRYVFRENTLNQSQVDVHGTAGMDGGRWVEIYENTFNNAAGAKASDKFADLRAGSGVVFNNHCGPGVCEDVFFREEDTGAWPRAYQPGSGYNGQTDGHSTCAVARGSLSNPSNTAPFYTWGNEMDVSTHAADTGVVVEGRDWIDSVSQPSALYQINKSGDTCLTNYVYAPLAYPHPLVN